MWSSNGIKIQRWERKKQVSVKLHHPENCIFARPGYLFSFEVEIQLTKMNPFGPELLVRNFTRPIPVITD